MIATIDFLILRLRCWWYARHTREACRLVLYLYGESIDLDRARRIARKVFEYDDVSHGLRNEIVERLAFWEDKLSGGCK